MGWQQTLRTRERWPRSTQEHHRKTRKAENKEDTNLSFELHIYARATSLILQTLLLSDRGSKKYCRSTNQIGMPIICIARDCPIDLHGVKSLYEDMEAVLHPFHDKKQKGQSGTDLELAHWDAGQKVRPFFCAEPGCWRGTYGFPRLSNLDRHLSEVVSHRKTTSESQYPNSRYNSCKRKGGEG